MRDLKKEMMQIEKETKIFLRLVMNQASHRIEDKMREVKRAWEEMLYREVHSIKVMILEAKRSVEFKEDLVKMSFRDSKKTYIISLMLMEDKVTHQIKEVIQGPRKVVLSKEK